MSQVKAKDLVHVLDRITGGRVVTQVSDIWSGLKPHVMIKSSNIPGKSCMEIPGLVCGDPELEIKRIAVCMTLTEAHIELAGATGVQAIVAHHPICDASNSGGVLLKTYLGLYGIAAFELHEAFHGLHPGLAFIHGHKAYSVSTTYGGVHGNVVSFGKTLPEVRTLGDMVRRLHSFMGYESEARMLTAERQVRDASGIVETNMATGAQILLGNEESPVSNVLHIHPHCGFSPAHMEQAKREHPEIDTVIASISRMKPDSVLVDKARELGLNLLLGNSHAMEILENGMPLAWAIQKLLPSCEVVIFRERVSSIPLQQAGTPEIRAYAEDMATRFLVRE